jgi:hypothetical protein
MTTRKDASKTIIKKHEMYNIKKSLEIALVKFRRQMNHNIFAPENLAQEKSVNETNVVKISTPITPKNKIK